MHVFYPFAMIWLPVFPSVLYVRYGRDTFIRNRLAAFFSLASPISPGNQRAVVLFIFLVTLLMGAPYYMHGIRQLPLCSFFLRLLTTRRGIYHQKASRRCSQPVQLSGLACCLLLLSVVLRPPPFLPKEWRQRPVSALTYPRALQQQMFLVVF